METTASIRRLLHGATEDMSFRDFAEFAIQDLSIAGEVAQRMLGGDVPYQWNPDEPEFYEEFEVIDADALRQQMALQGAHLREEE